MADQSGKVQALMLQTGIDNIAARDLLKATNWDLEAAVRANRCLKPPSQPQRPISGDYDNLYPSATFPRTNNAPGSLPPPLQPTALHPTAPAYGAVQATGPGAMGTGASTVGSSGTAGFPQLQNKVVINGGRKAGEGGSGTSNLRVETGGDVKRRSPAPSPQARRLERGFSKTQENMGIVKSARNVVLKDIRENSIETHFEETPVTSFVLPDLFAYDEEFRAFLHKDLIEVSTLVHLEQAGRLNWWADPGVCQRLWPLATSGDGNCLLHAASLAMWGFHDRKLTLRGALNTTLSGRENSKLIHALQRRWRLQQTRVNKESGLELDEKEWDEDWSHIQHLATTLPRQMPGSDTSCCESKLTRGSVVSESGSVSGVYESLEQFHVFVLSHVLRRPIIIIADTILRNPDGEALAPIPFGGVYLPLEHKPSDCHRCPLMLTYDSSHFSALVTMEGRQDSLPTLIPVVDPDQRPLPIHFAVDPGASVNWEKLGGSTPLGEKEKKKLLEKYLDIVDSPATGRGGHSLHRKHSDSSSGGSGDNEDKVKAKSVGSRLKSFVKKDKKKEKHHDARDHRTKHDILPLDTVQCKPSLTQSTAHGPELKQGTRVLCALLATKKSPKPKHWDSMVENYIAGAQQRFADDLALKRRQQEDMKQRLSSGEQDRRSRSPNPPPSPCVSQGCPNFGRPDTSFLCQDCYRKQKDQALSLQQPPGAPRYATMPNPSSSSRVMGASYSGNKPGTSLLHTGNPQRYPGTSQSQGTSEVHEGRSKFYASERPTATMPENRSRTKGSSPAPPSAYPPGPGRTKPLNNAFAPPSYQESEASQQELRVKQNVPRSSDRKTTLPLSSRDPNPETRPCKQAGCSFFGTAATSYFCSEHCKSTSSGGGRKEPPLQKQTAV